MSGGGNGDAIRLEGLAVTLGGHPILRAIEAEFLPGQIHAIVGPNGSGKTTLLRAIIGAVAAAAGRVRIGGSDAAGMERRELARRIALVPQDTHLEFPFRVDEIVLMGRYPHLRPLQRERPEDLQIASEAMRLLDLLPLRGRDVTTLSGGERQRVFIARALATEAPALLLDEPISHLDIGHRLDIFKMLRELADRRRTVVIALHDLDLACRFADRMTVLDRGSKAAGGEPGSVIDSGIFEKVFGVRITRHQAGSEPHFLFTRLP